MVSPASPGRSGSGYEVARPPRNGRASNTSTAKPASPSAAAAASPASPPPAMSTLFIQMPVCHAPLAARAALQSPFDELPFDKRRPSLKPLTFCALLLGAVSLVSAQPPAP